MTEAKIPRSVSRYFSELARKANAKIVPGSPEAKARTAKAREVLKAKWAERKAALAAAKLCPTER
jgi:homoserine kinase